MTAEFELTNAFSGAPTLVHGGVTLAVLDEAMAWACIAIGRQWAVTTETTARFHRTVRIGSRYRVEARVDEHGDGVIGTSALVLDRRGELRVDAHASFTTLGEAQATRLAGADIGRSNRRLLAE